MDPKQDSIISDPLKSSNSIESHLNGDEESSAVIVEVDKRVDEKSTIENENCSATIPLPLHTALFENATKLEIKEASEEFEDNDGASVKSSSSTSSTGSVWVMEDMVKSTASIQESPKGDPDGHRPGKIVYFSKLLDWYNEC